MFEYPEKMMLRKWLFSLLFVIVNAFHVHNVGAQNMHDDTGKINSLMTALDRQGENVAKIQTLNALSRAYEHDRNAALRYAAQAIELSKKLHNQNTEAESYLNYAKAYIGSSYYGEQGDIIRSMSYLKRALHLFKVNKNDFGAANCLFTIALAQASIEQNLGEAVKNLYGALKLYEKNGNLREMANCTRNIAAAYHALGDIENALKYSEKTLSMFRKINDADGIADSYNLVGTFHLEKNKINEGLSAFQKALEIYIKLGSKGVDLWHTLYLRQHRKRLFFSRRNCDNKRQIIHGVPKANRSRTKFQKKIGT